MLEGIRMIQGVVRFRRGVFRLPLWVQLSMGILMSANGIVPL